MIHVISVGPLSNQPGGIAAVVAELELCNDNSPGRIHFTVVDSGGIGRSIWVRLLTLFRGAILISLKRPSLVHLHVASRGSTWRKILLALVCVVTRIPYGIHLHGASYAAFLASQSPFRLSVIRLFFCRAQYTAVLGESWRRFVTSELRVPHENVYVVYNGVSESSFPPENDHADGTRYALFLGRIEPLKGVSDLLQAWEAVEDVGTHLVVAGSASDAATVDAVRRVAGQPERNVDFLGLLSRQDALELIRGAWVMVLPSYAEGLPMALIEAMSMQVPCIATDVGATRELIDDEADGFIVQPGDVAQLTDRLQQIMLSCDLRNRLALAAYEKWQARFDSKLMYDSLVEIWAGHAQRR